MKKKLEAELISIAHRILKMKNRSELDQLQAETLKLYEKISVLRFVEDNFADVKPTIGYASAEGKLEEIYGIEEVPEVHANEVEAKEDKKRSSPPTPKGGEAEGNKSDEPKKDVKEEDAKPEGDANTEQKIEEYQASEEEKEQSLLTPEGGDDEPETDDKPEAVEEPAKEEKPEEVKEPEAKEEDKEATPEEPEQKVEVVKPEAEVKAMEEGAAAVFEKEDDATIAEEEKAADAEVVTIEPDANAETEKSDASFDFAFERKPAPEEPQKQKEISFEDFHDYKEPEFVKKDEKKESQSQSQSAEEKKEEPKPEADDWRNWEPNKQSQSQPAEAKKEEPKAEADDWRNWEPNKQSQSQPAEEKKEEPKPESPKPTPAAEPATSRPISESFGKTITLGLNDRIAFEKNLFGGSSEDLNRVVSQINTQNSYDEAKAFIEDLVKPDYNNWAGKEDYETRFMELVEKRFS